MRKKLYAVMACVLLAGCELPGAVEHPPQYFHKFSQYIKTEFPVGTDEKVLIEYLQAEGYQYARAEDEVVEGFIWQSMTKTVGGMFPVPHWFPCSDEYSVTWHSDAYGKIDVITADGTSSCSVDR